MVGQARCKWIILGGGEIDAAWEGRSGPTDETHEASVRSTSLSLFSLHENAKDEVGGGGLLRMMKGRRCCLHPPLPPPPPPC